MYLDTTYLSIEVFNENDPPQITNIPDQVTNEDVPLRISLSAMELDGEPYFFEVSELSTDSITSYLVANGDSLLLVPYHNWSGSAVVSITVSDNFPSSTTTSFIIEVLPVDDEPFVDGFIPDLYFNEDFDHTFSEDLREVFKDIDGDLTFSVAFQTDALISGNCR